MRTKNLSTRGQIAAHLLWLGGFCLAALAPQASAELIIERTITANQIIPDNFQISSSFALTGLSSISDVTANVVLSSAYTTNPMYLGDMKATLTLGQTGDTGIKSATLFDYKGSGNNATSLNGTYAQPTAFDGTTPASNRWILTVADQSQGGIARLDSWKLTVTGTSATPGIILDVGTNGTIKVNGDTLTNVASTVKLAGTVTTTVGAAGQTLSFDGGVTGAGSIKKDGAGTLVMSGSNDYTGATIVAAGTLSTGATGSIKTSTSITVNNGGTLLLGNSSDQIGNTTGVNLAGGTLKIGDNVTGFNETVGALTLTSASIIDFGMAAGGAQLTLGSIIGLSATNTLTILNWTGNVYSGGGLDQLLITDGSGLSSTDLNFISFYSGSSTASGLLGNGTTQINFGSGSSTSGEVVPVPEPATLLGGVALLALIVMRERRRMAEWKKIGLFDVKKNEQI